MVYKQNDTIIVVVEILSKTNHFMGFPKVSKKNDAIMVVVENLSKTNCFIVVKSTHKAIDNNSRNFCELNMKIAWFSLEYYII